MGDHLKVHRRYVDDSIIIAPLWVLEEIAQYIKQRQEDRGLDLKIPKCKLRSLAGSQQLLDEATQQLFWWGTFIFFAGIALSAVSGAIGFLSNKST